MNILAKWLINSLVIIAAAYVLPGVHIASFLTAVAVALVLGILNLFIRPLLVLLTLPLTILTLGLFLLVINAVLILLTSNLVSGFVVDGFGWAVLFSLVVSILHLLTLRVFRSK